MVYGTLAIYVKDKHSGKVMADVEAGFDMTGHALPQVKMATKEKDLVNALSEVDGVILAAGKHKGNPDDILDYCRLANVPTYVFGMETLAGVPTIMCDQPEEFAEAVFANLKQQRQYQKSL